MLSRFRSNGVARASHVLTMYGIRFCTTTSAVKSSTTPKFVSRLPRGLTWFLRLPRLKLPERNKPDSVVNFFEKIGVSKSQIKTLVSSYPRLLFCDVDKTLKPKIEILQGLGLSESDLAKDIIKNGSFFARGVDTTIRPNLDYLRKLLHDDGSIVIKAIKKEPRLLSSNLLAVMPPNISFLQNLGFSSMDIEKLFLWKPRALLSNTGKLEHAVHRVEKIFPITRNSPMFIHGIIAFTSFDESTLEMKIEIFKDFGWPDSDIYTMVQRLPYCFSLSEATLRSRLNFFMKELGYGSSYLASRPALLMYSFEKRVVPRNDILKLLREKQLIKANLSLYRVVQCSEVEFLEKYVLPFRDEVPEVYDIYMKSR